MTNFPTITPLKTSSVNVVLRTLNSPSISGFDPSLSFAQIRAYFDATYPVSAVDDIYTLRSGLRVVLNDVGLFPFVTIHEYQDSSNIGFNLQCAQEDFAKLGLILLP